MDFSFGIEEEFFVVCEKTQVLESHAHEAFLARAKALSDGGVHRELLQSQVEATTPVCSDFKEARAHLRRLRAALVTAGQENGLSVIAAGTHPTAEWPGQQQTEKQRYDTVMEELKILGLRNLVCGMHVHVEVPDDELRIDVMRRIIPFLPVLLALSTSSPFWRGMDTGFSCYRLTAYDELPRTGLPPLFAGWAEYQDYVEKLQQAGVVADASYMWWAIRPSHKYQTLELRIADACTYVEDVLTVAALYRCLVRALIENRDIHAGIGSPERGLARENKWHVQRFGLAAELVNPFGETGAIGAREAVQQLLGMLRPHAVALDCLREAEGALSILARGTSSDRQRGIYRAALDDSGGDTGEALTRVKAWLAGETRACCEPAEA